MHFEKAGAHNTSVTVELALKRAKELNIKEIVVPSTKGGTAVKLLDAAAGAFEIVVVTSHAGFGKPFVKPMDDETMTALQARGAKIVRGSHALSGVERAVDKQYGGAYPVLIMADTLRLLGQGVKVAVEITVMAADAGTLSGAPIVALGGTHNGVDTALVLSPAHMNNFFDLKIHEVICKPFEI